MEELTFQIQQGQLSRLSSLIQEEANQGLELMNFLNYYSANTTELISDLKLWNGLVKSDLLRGKDCGCEDVYEQHVEIRCWNWS